MGGLGMELPPEHSRLFGYIDAVGWCEASTETTGIWNAGYRRAGKSIVYVSDITNDFPSF